MAQEHQEYIQQKVNPILENLVTQLLLERPEHMTMFMCKWLSEYSKIPLSAIVSEGVNELTELKAELGRLQLEVSELEHEQVTGAPSASFTRADMDEEEEEDDEDGCEAEMPSMTAYLSRGPRTSVSAEAYGHWNNKGDWTPPVYPKTEDQKNRIRAVLQESFLFASLDRADVNVLIDAMQEKTIEKGTRLIEQGADGDCLFVVMEGQMTCYKRVGGEEKVVKTYNVGGAFGELALLYNCPRAASVVADEGNCVVAQLDRESFNNIVRDAAYKRRERYEDFLQRVPLLQPIEDYERKSLPDALQPEEYSAGQVIVQQGEPGDKFYILEEGRCVATKVDVPGTTPKEVMRYSSGDYFGELALLRDEMRAATVTAETNCKLLSLSRRTFKCVLGPLEDILARNATERYG